MKFFFIVNGKKIKQFLFILIAAFFTAGILYVQKMEYPVFSTKDGPKALYKSEANSNKIALTFNIDWGYEKAVPIIDFLEEQGIKNVTFFISGAWAERNPNIVKRLIENEYDIGSLGYERKNYANLDEKKIKQDMLKANEIFKELGINKITLFRPPKGMVNEKILKIADSLHYSVIHWSINSKDHTNPGTKKIVDNVLSRVKGGDIVLLHASDSAKQTSNALPHVINGLKQKGYSLATVSTLISNADAKSKEID